MKYTTATSGKSIAEVIQVGMCEVVSNGSFKDGMGTAEWILCNSTQISITGKTKIPSKVEDQCTYRSKLGGIFSLVLMIQHICQYYKTTISSVSIACNGLGACFAKF